MIEQDLRCVWEAEHGYLEAWIVESVNGSFRALIHKSIIADLKPTYEVWLGGYNYDYYDVKYP